MVRAARLSHTLSLPLALLQHGQSGKGNAFSFTEIVTMWMVLICDNKTPGVGEPADFGLPHETAPELLLKRNRAALFATKREAIDAAKATGKNGTDNNHEWVKKYGFQIVECRVVDAGKTP